VTTVDIAASDLVAGSAKKLRPGRRPALDLRSLIEKDVQEVVSEAQTSPDQLERHICSAFMNGVEDGEY
jgi:hypothetical protein